MADEKSTLDRALETLHGISNRLDKLEGARKDAAETEAESEPKKSAAEVKLDAACTKLDALIDALRSRKDYEGNKRGEDPEENRDGQTDEDQGGTGEPEAQSKERAKALVADSKKDATSTFANRNKFADAQSLADSVYSAFSQSAFPPMAGEGLFDYRRRLLRPLQQHSNEFANVDLSRLDAATFAGIESRVYKDAMEVANNPAALCGPGQLRAVHRTDVGGRTRTEYYGDPSAWMDDFAPPVGATSPRSTPTLGHVARINKNDTAPPTVRGPSAGGAVERRVSGSF